MGVDDVIIHCPTKEEARAVHEHLHALGATWGDGASLIARTVWSYGAETCYRVFDGGKLKQGRKEMYETDLQFRHIPKCSAADYLYSTEEDFEVASDEMLMELLCK